MKHLKYKLLYDKSFLSSLLCLFAPVKWIAKTVVCLNIKCNKYSNKTLTHLTFFAYISDVEHDWLVLTSLTKIDLTGYGLVVWFIFNTF